MLVEDTVCMYWVGFWCDMVLVRVIYHKYTNMHYTNNVYCKSIRVGVGVKFNPLFCVVCQRYPHPLTSFTHGSTGILILWMHWICTCTHAVCECTSLWCYCIYVILHQTQGHVLFGHWTRQCMDGVLLSNLNSFTFSYLYPCSALHCDNQVLYVPLGSASLLGPQTPGSPCFHNSYPKPYLLSWAAPQN